MKKRTAMDLEQREDGFTFVEFRGPEARLRCNQVVRNFKVPWDKFRHNPSLPRSYAYIYAGATRAEVIAAFR